MSEEMKAKLQAMWAKVVEHKDLAIQVACALGGAIVGGLVVAVLTNDPEYVLSGDELIEDESESEEDEKE